MKRPSRLRTFFGLLLLLAVAVIGLDRPVARGDASNDGTITVKITGLRNHNGDLVFGIFKSADGFPAEKDKSVNWQVKPADADSIIFTAKLPPGKYAASVLHDENRDGKMDKSMFGVPLEGYGVTNNPKPKMRAATFDEATFTLGPQGISLTIDLQYFQ